MTRRITWKTLGTLAATAVVVAGVSTSKPAFSADHQDSPATKADPSADINDVYSWMDGNNVILGMTVFPFADTNAAFSDTVKYVFHLSSMTAYGATTSTDTDIICTFATDQTASCWVGTSDYVTGDASGTAGMTSAAGTKVFAGRIEDPFFFNLQGFKDAVNQRLIEIPSETKTAAGCYPLAGNESGPIVADLSETTSSNEASKTAADDFATAQGLAILISVDKSLVSSTAEPILAVWGATTN